MRHIVITDLSEIKDITLSGGSLATLIPSFMKISEVVQKLKWLTNRKHGALTNLPSFLIGKGDRLKATVQ